MECEVSVGEAERVRKATGLLGAQLGRAKTSKRLVAVLASPILPDLRNANYLHHRQSTRSLLLVAPMVIFQSRDQLPIKKT
jgi:hypothetical protein